MGLEPATSESLVRDLTTTPPSHFVSKLKMSTGKCPLKKAKIGTHIVLCRNKLPCISVVAINHTDIVPVKSSGVSKGRARFPFPSREIIIIKGGHGQRNFSYAHSGSIAYVIKIMFQRER